MKGLMMLKLLYIVAMFLVVFLIPARPLLGAEESIDENLRPPFGFADANGDGRNDMFRDEDGDGKDDISGQRYFHHFTFLDADGDSKNDVFRDADGDGINDLFRDEESQEKKKESVWYVLDWDNDGKNDVSGLAILPPEFVESEDGQRNRIDRMNDADGDGIDDSRFLRSHGRGGFGGGHGGRGRGGRGSGHSGSGGGSNMSPSWPSSSVKRGNSQAFWGKGTKLQGMLTEKDEITISGAVKSVKTIPATEEMCSGIQIVLEEQGNDHSILIGPEWYIKNQGFDIKEGAHMIVTGVKTRIKSRSRIIAASVKTEKETLLLTREGEFLF